MILFLDTSTDWIIFGLYDYLNGNYHQVKFQKDYRPKDSVTKLVYILQDFIPNIHRIERILVGNGPGSFAGVRTACAVGKNISQLLQIPVKGVSILEMICYDSNNKSKIAFIDGKMNKYYAGYWENGIFKLSDLNVEDLILLTERFDNVYGDVELNIPKMIHWKDLDFNFSQYIDANYTKIIGDFSQLSPNYVRDSYVEKK
jgi:tRNA threonylcarbamoyl adenosine modification protein YeaZ